MWRCGSIKCLFHPGSLSRCPTRTGVQAVPQAALTVFVLQLLLVSDGWSGLQKLTRAPPMATMTASRNKSSTFRDCFNPKGTNATAETLKCISRSFEWDLRMSNCRAYLNLCSCCFSLGFGLDDTLQGCTPSYTLNNRFAHVWLVCFPMKCLLSFEEKKIPVCLYEETLPGN